MDINNLFRNEKIIFLAHIGFLTQPLISGIIDSLEKINEKNMEINLPSKLYIIFIEMAQNIMHYSLKECHKAFILIGKESQNEYYILSENLVTEERKKKLENILNEIKSLSKEEIKKLYKERRKSGRDSHSSGAGIGFLEIAKIAEKVEFDFIPEKENYIFRFKVYIKSK